MTAAPLGLPIDALPWLLWRAGALLMLLLVLPLMRALGLGLLPLAAIVCMQLWAIRFCRSKAARAPSMPQQCYCAEINHCIMPSTCSVGLKTCSAVKDVWWKLCLVPLSPSGVHTLAKVLIVEYMTLQLR